MKTVTPLTMCNYTAFNNISPVSPRYSSLSLSLHHPFTLSLSLVHLPLSLHHQSTNPSFFQFFTSPFHHFHHSIITASPFTPSLSLTPLSLTQLLPQSITASFHHASLSHSFPHSLPPKFVTQAMLSFITPTFNHSFTLHDFNSLTSFSTLSITPLLLHQFQSFSAP